MNKFRKLSLRHCPGRGDRTPENLAKIAKGMNFPLTATGQNAKLVSRMFSVGLHAGGGTREEVGGAAREVASPPGQAGTGGEAGRGEHETVLAGSGVADGDEQQAESAERMKLHRRRGHARGILTGLKDGSTIRTILGGRGMSFQCIGTDYP